MKPDKLESIVRKQAALMQKLKIPTLKPLPNSAKLVSGEHVLFQELTEESKDYFLALQVEIIEVLQELNWKSWKKTKKPVSLSKVHEELVDCLHFLVELCIMFGMDAKRIHDVYMEKMAVNLERQRNGY